MDPNITNVTDPVAAALPPVILPDQDLADLPALDMSVPGEPERKAMPKPKELGALYHNKRLTRDGMRQAIREGGSVSYKGRIIWRAQDLPTELELAGDDEVAQAEAISKMKAAHAQLSAAIKQHEAGKAGKAQASK